MHHVDRPKPWIAGAVLRPSHVETHELGKGWVPEVPITPHTGTMPRAHGIDRGRYSVSGSAFAGIETTINPLALEVRVTFASVTFADCTKKLTATGELVRAGATRHSNSLHPGIRHAPLPHCEAQGPHDSWTKAERRPTGTKGSFEDACHAGTEGSCEDVRREPRGASLSCNAKRRGAPAAPREAAAARVARAGARPGRPRRGARGRCRCPRSGAPARPGPRPAVPRRAPPAHSSKRPCFSALPFNMLRIQVLYAHATCRPSHSARAEEDNRISSSCASLLPVDANVHFPDTTGVAHRASS